MNVLFLTLLDFESARERNIYTDLLREFVRHGHKVFAISPTERRKRRKTHVAREEGCVILKLRIGNTQKIGIVEKGISTVTIEPLFIRAIKKYFKGIKFDLVLYSTPPITFCRAVEYVKRRDGASTYLMLKDIFPQNAVDMGMMAKRGMRGALYRYFRRKEKRLYGMSDRIGCMSEANVKYVLEHNPEVMKRNERAIKISRKPIVEICPNSIEPVDMSITSKKRHELRDRYHIPQDKLVFVYGGNLGKPQGISFMLKCLHSQRENNNVFFLIVGDGTEYIRIKRYIEKYKPQNISLHQWLPKEDYDVMVAACDVGMIFLDHRFTIPNFPSRLLGYMQAKLPILAVTDSNTDIGKVIVENGLGWWCESNDVGKFDSILKTIDMGSLDKGVGYDYLCFHYNVNKTYKIISGFKDGMEVKPGD